MQKAMKKFFGKPHKQTFRITSDVEQNFIQRYKNLYLLFSRLISFIFYPLRFIRYYEENFYPLFKLINKSFNKSLILTFLAFWYPFIFIIILANVLPAQTIIFSIGIMIPTVVGMQLLPTLMVSFKESSLLKKIGATKIETWMLSVSFISYFILVSLVSIVLNVGIGIAIKWNDLIFGKLNWPIGNGAGSVNQVINIGQYFFALFVGMIVGISVGMMIAGLVKTPAGATLVGLLITLPGGFLSGQFLSYDLLNNVPVLNDIGYIFPQKWPTLLAVIATSGGNIFDFVNGGKIIGWQNYGAIVNVIDSFNKSHVPLPQPFIDALSHKYPPKITVADKTVFIASFIVPWIMTAGSLGVTIKWFKWHSR